MLLQDPDEDINRNPGDDGTSSGSHHILKLDELPDDSFNPILRAFMYSEYNNQWKVQCT